MAPKNIIGAFSEENASRLSGVSCDQLRHWHKRGLMTASMGPQDGQGVYQRIYSFRDLVALRVLNVLRNDHKVSLQHLRAVADKLSHDGPERWTATTLYVLGKRVVFDDPRTNERKEVVSGQRVLDIPISAAISDTREAIQRYNMRSDDELGHVVRRKFVQENQIVFARSRIPVSVVKEYLQRGLGAAQIMADFPDLTEEDIRSVGERFDPKIA